MKIALLSLSVLCFSSFANAQALTLEHSSASIVVPGKASSCTDIRGSSTSPYPTSLQSDFFKLPLFKMQWNGTNQLVIAAIRVNVAHPYLVELDQTISGQDLVYMFGNEIFEAGSTIDINDYSNGATCSFGVGGIARLPQYKNVSFNTEATIEVIGYSQDSDGTNFQPVRASSKVQLYFF